AVRRRRAARQAGGRRRRSHDADGGTAAHCGSEEGSMSPVARAFRPAVAALLLLSSCVHRPTDNPNVIVVGVTSGPNNLDPRVGTDDVSAKTAQLLFNNLMTLDEHLRVAPDLAQSLENPDPTTYVVTLKKGVKLHDGHELTSADVVHTFRSLLDPAFISPRKGAYRMVKSIDARDRYTVVFALKEPFGSFP